MAGKALLTLLGRSTWALINTYYALLAETEYYPDKIFIITEEPYKEQLVKAREGLEILSSEHGFTPEISEISLPASAFIEAGKNISTLVKELKANDYEIAIDITGGKKSPGSRNSSLNRKPGCQPCFLPCHRLPRRRFKALHDDTALNPASKGLARARTVPTVLILYVQNRSLRDAGRTHLYDGVQVVPLHYEYPVSPVQHLLRHLSLRIRPRTRRLHIPPGYVSEDLFRRRASIPISRAYEQNVSHPMSPMLYRYYLSRRLTLAGS